MPLVEKGFVEMNLENKLFNSISIWFFKLKCILFLQAFFLISNNSSFVFSNLSRSSCLSMHSFDTVSWRTLIYYIWIDLKKKLLFQSNQTERFYLFFLIFQFDFIWFYALLELVYLGVFSYDLFALSRVLSLRIVICVFFFFDFELEIEKRITQNQLVIRKYLNVDVNLLWLHANSPSLVLASFHWLTSLRVASAARLPTFVCPFRHRWVWNASCSLVRSELIGIWARVRCIFVFLFPIPFRNHRYLFNRVVYLN